jgi:hypothetical protein
MFLYRGLFISYKTRILALPCLVATLYFETDYSGGLRERGYNRFLEISGNVSVAINEAKIREDGNRLFDPDFWQNLA